MKTILITGGTDGVGKGIAMHYIKKGDYVIIVGSSSAKGEKFLEEAKQLGARDRAVFIQANLSLIKENNRIIREIKENYSSIDKLIFCAASQKHRDSITITEEGFEFVFALMYLSRYILSYGLIDVLEKAEKPIIMNIAAPGMKGEVNWSDLQFRNNYDSNKVKFHSSRLNDLLGVSFAKKESSGKIKYILFNPWAVKTSGGLNIYQSSIKNLFIKLAYQIIGKSVDKTIVPIIKLLDNPPNTKLSAFKLDKTVSLEMETYNSNNARRLDQQTRQLLKDLY